MRERDAMATDIAQISARLDGITPGKWHETGENSVWHGSIRIAQLPSYFAPSDPRSREQRANATFIAHAPEDIRSLLADIAEKDAEIARLRRAGRNVEYMLNGCEPQIWQWIPGGTDNPALMEARKVLRG